MHFTVLHAGPQDSAREVDQITREVTRRAADTDPFEVRLSRPDIGTLAIESKGCPGRPHRQLWEMTWQTHQAVVGDRWPRIPTASYPHLSHAYAGAQGYLADRSKLKVMLSDLPGGPVAVPVSALTLVAEWHHRREVVWDILAEVPLDTRPWGMAPGCTAATLTHIFARAIACSASSRWFLRWSRSHRCHSLSWPGAELPRDLTASHSVQACVPDSRRHTPSCRPEARRRHADPRTGPSIFPVLRRAGSVPRPCP
ncbi:hypothetical protein BIV23_39550 [Streptomyces monashensis]|uniref:Uncharacterized protein n=1 Tax=Streptomyces monashensis TaxID=1678012 RepID=A0A1S2PCT3_9ACTN|nr:hypothetical protein BIV23_39550 [Streptomyces monashensis]